jgi:uncharacterized protein YfiM (DUF2279 family)
MFPLALPLLATAGSGLLTGLMNPGRGYRNAQREQEKYYNQAQGYLQPYATHGEEAYGNLSGAMNNLMNPSAFYDQLLGNYHQSDASRFAQERAMENGLRGMSSMGMLGSTPGLQALQAGASQICAEDEQRYIDRMINQYLQGAGIAQGIYGQGANAASAMGGNAMNMGGIAGDTAYNRAAAPGQMFSNLLGTGAGLAGSYMNMQGMNNMANAWNTTGRPTGQ